MKKFSFYSLTLVLFLFGCGDDKEGGGEDFEFQNMLPDLDIFFIYIAFYLAGFENQRWVRAGTYNSSVVREIVENTGLLVMAFMYLYLLAYAFDKTIIQALMLFLATLILAPFRVVLLGGDMFWKWILGTALVYPLMWQLSVSVTWFGLFE